VGPGPAPAQQRRPLPQQRPSSVIPRCLSERPRIVAGFQAGGDQGSESQQEHQDTGLGLLGH
jgi:hypothetical protein